ncbi:hypothetical protein ONS95_011620 [Cadophora gregata]|uniref:uncharacterized protein n=1 Tax=Cadophora gregata TaxID=51156 RepID=UPI0026DD7CF0|nr:uncharacterized protein ONS95_011620 [Cadophora gregata]KAK0120214.1 hypothetical protein ONS95_011620 [Cadophora gregata]KAK0121247.1 hypothetical protein ONS96_011424 [Cadophora gregata f. sp. sojae]
MVTTRKRKSLELEACVAAAAASCKRVCAKYTDEPPSPQHIVNEPQTPQADKKRITIRLITPSAPKKMRLRIPIRLPKTTTRVLTPYPSPPLDSYSDKYTPKLLESVFEARQEEEERQCEERDVNELLDLYFLADGFGREDLKREIRGRLERGEWIGKVEKEGLKRCFGELEREDGVRRWVVRALVAVWSGGEGLGYEIMGEDMGGQQDWSWVSEEMREDVLTALRNGEEEDEF